MTNIWLFVILMTGAFIASGFFVFRLLFSRKPVLEISLSGTDHPGWSDRKRIAELIDTFQRHGFDLAGHYECWEMPGLFMAGFVKPSEQMIGVIYDHPIAGIWTDIGVQYADGKSLTVSNAHSGHEMDHMPQSTKIYLRGGSFDELMSRVLAERKNTGRITISKEEWASHIEHAYQKEMKWRMDRGGPTSLEIMRTATGMGVSLDSEKLISKTLQVRNIWKKERDRPRKTQRKRCEADLPREFQQPEAFRQRMEQKSAPMPRMKVPVLPVYVILLSAMTCWCYYGYQYNDAHGPVSLADLTIFFSIFIVLFVAFASFGQHHQQVRLCASLQRISGSRPGAFLFIAGASPIMLYAREGWLGKLTFQASNDGQDACTRLEAITKRSGGWLLITRKGLLSRIFGRSDKDNIPLPESDFSRNFEVSGNDREYAEKWLGSNVTPAIMKLNGYKGSFVDMDGKSMTVEIGEDLSGARKKSELMQFLDVAETIVEAVVQQHAAET